MRGFVTRAGEGAGDEESRLEESSLDKGSGGSDEEEAPELPIRNGKRMMSAGLGECLRKYEKSLIFARLEDWEILINYLCSS